MEGIILVLDFNNKGGRDEVKRQPLFSMVASLAIARISAISVAQETPKDQTSKRKGH